MHRVLALIFILYGTHFQPWKTQCRGDASLLMNNWVSFLLFGTLSKVLALPCVLKKNPVQLHHEPPYLLLTLFVHQTRDCIYVLLCCNMKYTHVFQYCLTLQTQVSNATFHFLMPKQVLSHSNVMNPEHWKYPHWVLGFKDISSPKWAMDLSLLLEQ